MQIHASLSMTAKGVAGKGDAACFQHGSIIPCTGPARRQMSTRERYKIGRS